MGSRSRAYAPSSIHGESVRTRSAQQPEHLPDASQHEGDANGSISSGHVVRSDLKKGARSKKKKVIIATSAIAIPIVLLLLGLSIFLMVKGTGKAGEGLAAKMGKPVDKKEEPVSATTIISSMTKNIISSDAPKAKELKEYEIISLEKDVPVKITIEGEDVPEPHGEEGKIIANIVVGDDGTSPNSLYKDNDFCHLVREKRQEALETEKTIKIGEDFVTSCLYKGTGTDHSKWEKGSGAVFAELAKVGGSQKLFLHVVPFTRKDGEKIVHEDFIDQDCFASDSGVDLFGKVLLQRLESAGIGKVGSLYFPPSESNLKKNRTELGVIAYAFVDASLPIRFSYQKRHGLSVWHDVMSLAGLIAKNTKEKNYTKLQAPTIAKNKQK